MERVNFLLDHVVKMDKTEQLYFKILVKDKLFAATNIDVAAINVHWPQIRMFGKLMTL